MLFCAFILYLSPSVISLSYVQALSFIGGFDKVLLPHLVEKEVVKEDGSVVRRSEYGHVRQMCA